MAMMAMPSGRNAMLITTKKLQHAAEILLTVSHFLRCNVRRFGE